MADFEKASTFAGLDELKESIDVTLAEVGPSGEVQRKGPEPRFDYEAGSCGPRPASRPTEQGYERAPGRPREQLAAKRLTARVEPRQVSGAAATRRKTPDREAKSAE